MLNLTDALNVLRLDSGANDDFVYSLLEAIPGYIEVTTGMSIEQQETEPLVDTVQRTIDNLLKCITLKVQRNP